MRCRTAICLAIAMMLESRGLPAPGRSSSHGSASVATRDDRLGEDIFQFGLARGEKHAKAGLDFSAEMTKNLGTVTWFGFGGSDLDLDARGRQLLDRIYAAPPHLYPAYFEAFLAGYKLGHTLNLPKKQQTLLTSLDHLIRIGRALVEYSQEKNGRLPPMNDVPTLRKTLSTLVKADDFVNPITGEPYKLNSSLSNHKWLELKKRSKDTVVVYEGTAAPDSSHGVVFVTGEARRVSKREWLRLKERSRI
jgi:hypothetical protein